MGLISRRHFLADSALAASALFGGRFELLAAPASSVSTDAAAMRKLAGRLRGRIIMPSDSTYESARLIFNRAFDRHPALIVRCATGSDVLRAIDFGRRQGLALAVRAGGHSFAGHSVCDGGMVIDLSDMKQVVVDTKKRTVRAEAGLLVGDLDKATQVFGLATPSGGCASVGIAGLTLGGGETNLMAKYGTSCDNLVSAQVATVDGRLLDVSREKSPDLFWAIRGGGGNFGVATSFEYRLHPVAQVLAGMLTYPPARALDALHGYRDFVKRAPDELMAPGSLVSSPEGPRFRIHVLHCGEVTAGNDLIKPLRALGPEVDAVKPMSYLDYQATAFPAAPAASFATGIFVSSLGDTTASIVFQQVEQAPSAVRVLVVPFYGFVTRVPVSETAFALRQPGYDVWISCRWSAPDAQRAAVQWASSLRTALRPFAHGAYVNSLGEEGEDLVKAAYGPNYARLVELMAKYDPTNLLHLNHNIKPTG